MQAIARYAVPALVFVLACAAASAQTALYTFDGDSAGSEFGSSVSGAGDVDGDGFDDLIVGAPLGNSNGPIAGLARVFSGVDGSVLYSFDGDSQGDHFGFSVSGAGDVNGDGFADLIVGAHHDANNGSDSGSARVISGRDGSILYTFDGDSAGDSFGSSVAGAGDVNGDGFTDLIVGAPLDDNHGIDSGSARVFSGMNGAVLFTFDGDSSFDEFGSSVSGAGDVNGDGFDDLIVGAHRDDNNGANSGSARAFSGVDGSILHTFDGNSAEDRFGFSVSSAGDANMDGYADLIVGAPFADNNLNFNSGMARVFSGVDGSVLHTFDGDSSGDALGLSVAGAGDVNSDGFADQIVGAPLDDDHGFNSGSARVFSGVDGAVLFTFHGDSASDLLGWSVSGAGDVNGGGFDDLIAGARDDDNNGWDSGSARVFSGCDALGVNYCSPAVPNSSGQPAEIHACGSDAVSDNRLHLSADNLPTNQFGYFLNSQTQASTFPVPDSQGVLCVGGAIGRYSANVFNTGSAGTSTVQLDLANTPTPAGTVAIQAGESWNFTAWFRDLNPTQTSNFTDAVTVTFF